MKLFTKNFLYTVSIIFLVATLLLGTLYIVMPRYYLYTKEKEATKEFSDVVKSIKDKSIEDIQSTLAYSQRSRDGLNISVFSDKEKQTIYPTIDVSRIDLEINLSEPIQTTTNKVMKESIVDANKKALTVYGEYSIQPISEARQVLIKLYPLLLVTSLVLGGIAAFFYSRYSTKRILKMLETTTNMMSLNPDVACDMSGKDEITQLATNINRLYDTHLRTISALKKEVDKVEQVEKSKSEFMRMASHELKTPLAGMMGIVEGMIYNVGKFQDHDTYLKMCRELLINQSNLVQNILSISSLDNIKQLEDNVETISLKEIVNEQLESYLLLSELGNYQVTKEFSGNSNVLGNRLMIERVISNILSNAFRYSTIQTTIQVILEDNVFCVKNLCSNIELDNPMQLFEPFYRSDYSRNKQDGGSGLGLFIVKQLADKNNWKVDITIDEQQLFVVTVVF
ncbi:MULTISPECIES: HAMP domain-containing sensor histidine kinase [Vagococcus]|uniref:HAMP domain-containing sensor histidine kinase n=1 Tax=Vagococcus TaxID=2737 RepID=UPI000E51CFD2|nr:MULTISPECIES: HAMP domain-containing sensor histidine kinase [Vagococcus]RHH66546.1 sensor histidine kinase [Vagococcus sp. AM17-17]